ncbi:MAG: membrane dipeptidase [candidate division KSB1 bacterium]|nr:membrane dipeptidase [candidate division KSB1 bacterium]MDZ7301115.1 membrane dipeptidase [candidate division KSB1 bacterium]MDZ7312000.1 membrane dipeptidase [candidate division KSB1 bacterium]
MRSNNPAMKEWLPPAARSLELTSGRRSSSFSVWVAVLLLNLMTAIPDGSLYGQSFMLSGTVKDGYTGAPLDSALVEIISTHDGRRDSAFTDATGEWRLVLATSVREESANMPSGFYVLPSFPNPYHPPTQLRFFTSRSGRVEIAVYNLLGQQLDALSADLDAGEYAVQWGGKGGRGILFYSISINGVGSTGKMIQLANGNSGLGKIVRNERLFRTGSLSKAVQLPYKFIASRFAYEPDTLVQNLTGDTRIDFVLDTVHRRALVIDLHNDVLEKVVRYNYQLGVRHLTNHSDIPRFRDGGVDVQLFSIWIDPTLGNPYQQALRFFDSLHVQIARNPRDLVQARTLEEIEKAQIEGKIAAIPVVEGGYSIENSLNKLKDLFARGARYMTITWNRSGDYGPDWAISADDPRSTTVGLSDFGRQVIQTMDSLGMLIDVSHTGIKTIEDILTVTRNPIIASHSGARALCDHTRNLYDDQIRQIANSGGVIGVVFYPYFLTGTRRATLNDVVRHIDYIAKLVGVDYVAIGSDFDGIEVTPTDLKDVSKFPLLTEALLKKGYSRAEVRKILGENFLRVFRQVCK